MGHEISANEPVFISQKSLTHMYWVISGDLNYHRGERNLVAVDVDDWFGEHTMWTNEWMSCGDLVTVSPCSILLVGVHAIRTAVQENGELWALMCAYAKGSLDWLLQLDASMFTDHFNNEDYRPLVQGWLSDGFTLIKSSGVDNASPKRESKLSGFQTKFAKRLSLNT